VCFRVYLSAGPPLAPQRCAMAVDEPDFDDDIDDGEEQDL
jgi:hypothetical protein